MQGIKPETPLVMLTVAQFEELISKKTIEKSDAAPVTALPKRYVYGLKGICELFDCSHSKAQQLKDEVIKEAVSQNGRKIVVDADLAIELFNERKTSSYNQARL